MSVWESSKKCSKHFQAWNVLHTASVILVSFPDPGHPLTRRNGLVNQIKFPELAHTFATLSPSNIYAKPTQKRYGYSIKIVSEVLCNNHLSRNLIGLLDNHFTRRHRRANRLKLYCGNALTPYSLDSSLIYTLGERSMVTMETSTVCCLATIFPGSLMFHFVVVSGKVAENAHHFKIFLFCLKAI